MYRVKGFIQYILCLVLLLPLGLFAQERFKGAEVAVEATATTVTGNYAPLWLTANRYGLGSVRPHSLVTHAQLTRDLRNDSARVWQLGYGVDVALAFGHERSLFIQQAYAEGAWKLLHLTIGAKEQPMEVQNRELSSGALSMGINANPIPQVRLDIDWFSFPGTQGWWQWKLNGSYGIMTDGSWQEGWAQAGTRYVTNTLYHEKALYWKFGRPDIFPLTYEIGLRMATEFGGTSYNVETPRYNDGKPTTLDNPADAGAFIDALFCRGDDVTDGSNPNVSGNHLGSYVMQLKYHGRSWQARLYWERFFEDHSMLTVQYGIRDMLLGGEATLPRNPYVSSIVVEYLGTRDQSGAVYHDGTRSLPDAMAGRDNYYNHLQYTGWQYYGQAIGHPFITSPLYNDIFGRPHILRFYNNRVKAWHVGLSGDPTKEWHWRVLASFTRNWGTYDWPLNDRLLQQHYLAEATYRPRWAKGWQGVLGIGLDHGDLLGNSFGIQLSIRKKLTMDN